MAFQVVEEQQALSSLVLPLIHEGISELWQEGHFPDQFLHFPVSATDRVIYVMSKDNDAVGVLCYDVRKPVVEVTLLYVEPSSRRTGIANLMWDKMLNIATEHGIISVQASVSAANAGAREFLKQAKAEPAVIKFETVIPENQG